MVDKRSVSRCVKLRVSQIIFELPSFIISIAIRSTVLVRKMCVRACVRVLKHGNAAGGEAISCYDRSRIAVNVV